MNVTSTDPVLQHRRPPAETSHQYHSCQIVQLLAAIVHRPSELTMSKHTSFNKHSYLSNNTSIHHFENLDQSLSITNEFM